MEKLLVSVNNDIIDLVFSHQCQSLVPQGDLVQERRGSKVPVFPCHETPGGRAPGQLFPHGQVGH